MNESQNILRGNSNPNLSVSVTEVGNETKKGFLSNKTFSCVHITIREVESGKCAIVTVRGDDEGALKRTVRYIKENMENIHGAEEAMRVINRGVIRLRLTNKSDTEDKEIDHSKIAKKTAKIFNKCFDKNELIAEKNLKFLSGVEKYHAERVGFANFQQILDNVQKHPNSKEAWGKFYAYVESYGDDEVGLKTLFQHKEMVESLLNQGIALARHLQTSYAEEGSIGISISNPEDPGVMIAEKMEHALLHVLEQLNPVKIRVLAEDEGPAGVTIHYRVEQEQEAKKSREASDFLQVPSAFDANQVKQAQYQEAVQIIHDARSLRQRLDKSLENVKSEQEQLQCMRAANASWRMQHPEVRNIQVSDEEFRLNIGERPSEKGIDLDFYKENCGFYLIEKQTRMARERLKEFS